MREDENSHRGIDRETQIDKNIIDSNDYRRKFDNATENPVINKILYDSAKEILEDRSGSRYETMYWIDGDTEKIITKYDRMGKTQNLFGEKYEFKVDYGKNILAKLKGHNNIIVIHNHPNSTAPSAGDFNSALNHNYHTGFVVTHNGRLFKYSSNQEINDTIYDYYWQGFYKELNNEVEAQIKAIEKIARNSDIYFEEVFRK
jgi:proteasome lid subunit RPN8/RPN11